MLELPKGTKYNMVRLHYALPGRTVSAPSRIRFVYAQNGGATGSYQDLVSESIFNVKSHDRADKTFKIPVRTEQWLGFHLNSGASDTRGDFEFKIYDWEVYYNGALLNTLEMPENVMIDSKRETRVKITPRSADGEVMEDLTGYEWSFAAVKGCERISGDAGTGEIIIPADAKTGTYRVTLTNIESPELCASAEAVINPDPDNWEQMFNKLIGPATIQIPDSGTESAVYQAYTEDGEVMPNQEQISWRLDKVYKGVALSGSAVTVESDADESVIRLYAAYDGHEIYTDINLKRSRYGKDLAAGKELKYLSAANADRFTNKTGEKLATDSNPETFYTTGTMTSDPQNKGGQIMPMLTLDRGAKFNVIRVNYELAMTSDAPSGLRLVYSPVGGASSQYVNIVPPEELKTQKYDKFIKIPVRSEQYVGFHLNTGTSATGKWVPELKLYDFEIYYDGSQLNRIELPSAARVDRERETRVPITAFNADGNVMEDLSEYQWSGSAQTGCENVFLDAAAGELVVPSNAMLGTYSVTLSNIDNPELSLSASIEIGMPLSEMGDYFHHIGGAEQVVIPKQGKAEHRYKVYDKNGAGSAYPDLVTWKLAEAYPGVSLDGPSVAVTNEAKPGTVTLEAVVGGDHTITFQIKLVEASASTNALISEIEGDKFVVSPYYGEQEMNQAQYKAKTYDGMPIDGGVKWSVKAAPFGVTMDQDTGILSVPPNVNDVKVKVIAEKDGLCAEKLVTLVSRYDGGPNLLRLPGVTINKYANENTEYSYDGNFSTKSTTAIYANAKSVNMTLPKKYFIDTLRVYKDFGGFENSYQTTARINGTAFGGKGWSNSPLEADIWQAGPAFESNVLQYTFIPRDHATDIYEMELYSSYIRFDRVDSSADPGGYSIRRIQYCAVYRSGGERSAGRKYHLCRRRDAYREMGTAWTRRRGGN